MFWRRCDAPWVSYVLVWSGRTMWWCYAGNCFSFFEHGIFVSAAERCRRKWIFPAGQSSVVCHGFCSRCSGVDAMRHGSRMGFGGQVSICGGDCCDGWRLSLFACLLHVSCIWKWPNLHCWSFVPGSSFRTQCVGIICDAPWVVCVLAWPCGVIRWLVVVFVLLDFTALWVFCDPANGRILLVDVSLSVPVCKYVEEA